MISAIKKLVELVGSEPINGLTPFGHQVGAKNGKIDMNLLNGAYSLEKLTQGLSEVKRNNIENIDDKHLCHRVRDHLNWMAKNMLSHGGFESRLAKVHGATQARQLVQKIAPHLKEIADSVSRKYGVDISCDNEFVHAESYEHGESNEWIKSIKKGFKNFGIKPVEIPFSFGASDANVFQEYGIDVAVLGNGVKNTHSPDEQVRLSDLDKLKDYLVRFLSN